GDLYWPPVVERVVELLEPYLSPPWGYLIVGLATFLENSVGAGVVVPGETLVIVGGFYARVGALSLPWVIAVSVAGAILGDNLGYLLGRRFGRGLLERHGHRLLVTPARLAAADAYYRRHGGKTVFLGRFIPVVRSVGFILAGVSHMPWRRFAAYDAAGSVLWGAANALLGYALGEAYARAEGYLRVAGLVLLVLLAGAIWLSKRRRERRKIQEELGDASPEAVEVAERVDGE
ncbi:MAG TPA: DedA family protein, partial [Actinomycetota bacterium]|nr:DedA family protein [Actinomycetota bacterium]